MPPAKAAGHGARGETAPDAARKAAGDPPATAAPTKFVFWQAVISQCSLPRLSAESAQDAACLAVLAGNAHLYRRGVLAVFKGAGDALARKTARGSRARHARGTAEIRHIHPDGGAVGAPSRLPPFPTGPPDRPLLRALAAIWPVAVTFLAVPLILPPACRTRCSDGRLPWGLWRW